MRRVHMNDVHNEPNINLITANTGLITPNTGLIAQNTGNKVPPRALTIAGSDSGGGAGIQADLKTFQELDVFGTSVITSLTAQNSQGVHGIWPSSAASVAGQLDAVLSDIGTDAVKIGMLGSAEMIAVIVRYLRFYKPPNIVIDPVMLSKHGASLLQEDALSVLRKDLFPLADIITPNIPETCLLLGWQESEVRTITAMKEAARALLQTGAKYVLVKGGHLHEQAEEGVAVDVLISRENPQEAQTFSAARVQTIHTHGTGCTTSSAIAAYLALGLSMPAAVAAAKQFTYQAIALSVPLGQGIGSLWHAAHRTP